MKCFQAVYCYHDSLYVYHRVMRSATLFDLLASLPDCLDFADIYDGNLEEGLDLFMPSSLVARFATYQGVDC